MVLTISIEGKGVIANADAVTNDTGGDGTGDWGFTGSGGVSNGLTTDTYKYGSASVSAALSGTKNGWLWFNTGTGTGYPLDFSGSGAELGQHIYIWVACPTIGLTQTLVNEGVTIRIGSSTSNYNDYTIAGSDGSNGWDGKWKCFVIDPTKTASATGGTINLASIQYIGARMSTTATAKGDNLFISQIAVGKGIRVTGTSTTGWKEVVDYCIDYPNRAWGMFQEREGTYYQYGNLYIGDTTQTANVSFTDSGRVIQAGISEYWISGTGWVTSADIDYTGIIVEDHASYTTTFTDGVIVGTDNGRSGSTIIGTSNHDYSMDLYGGNNAGSLTAFYGTTLKDITGAINSGNDADHKFLGVSFIGCNQFDPVGAPVIRNSVFAETASTEAALLWNANIDVQDTSFIANTLGAGYEYTAAGSYSQTNLTYSGNTYDLLYSAAASSGQLTINATDSNPNTSEITNATGNSVSILNSVNLNIFIKDANNNAVEGASVAIYQTSDDTQLMNELSAVTTGLATESYNYLGDTNVYIRVRKSSTGTRYYPVRTTGTITNTGLTLTITLTEDGIAG